MSIPLEASLGAERPQRELPWVRIAAAIYLPMAAIGAAWIAWREGSGELATRLWHGTAIAPPLATGIGVGAGLAVVGAGRLASGRWRAVQRLELSLARLLGPVPNQACILLALLSGFGEEVLFRGALLPEVGLPLSAVIFGLLHWPMERDLIAWTPFAFAAGLLFGALYLWTGSIVAPAVAHAVINGINMAYLRRHWLPGGELYKAHRAPRPGSEEADSVGDTSGLGYDSSVASSSTESSQGRDE